MSEKYYKAIIDGLFWGQEQIARHMIDGLRRYGWSDEEIYFVWTNPKMREDLIAQVAAHAIITDGFLLQAHESIMVKMTCGRTFAESVAVGQYSRIGKHVNENTFPINGPASSRPLLTTANGPYRTDDKPHSDGATKIVLVNMRCKAKSGEALEYMKTHKLRPIETMHLLAIGEYFAQHPDEQRQFKVVGLGSSGIRFGGGEQVLGVGGSASDRFLETFWYATLWNEQTRFGAIAEEAL